MKLPKERFSSQFSPHTPLQPLISMNLSLFKSTCLFLFPSLLSKMPTFFLPTLLLLLIAFATSVSGRRDLVGDFLRLPSETDNDDNFKGTRWAVLLAGSNGYWNYRHQVHLLYTCMPLQFLCFSSLLSKFSVSRV